MGGLPSVSEQTVRGASVAVAQVLDDAGAVVGAGFLVAGAALVTCAHVVAAAGSGPGERIRVLFPQVLGATSLSGWVPADFWRGPDGLDVAVIQLDAVVDSTTPVVLGPAAECAGHRVHSFGFPAHAPVGGHFGYGTAGHLLTDPGAGVLLQLTAANDMTTGFSGAPVVDEVTGRVIGMVTAIAPADPHLRGLGIVYATPTEVLQQVHTGLLVSQISPYRYLDAFTAEDARWFHGRAAAVEGVLDALAQHRGVLLLGPSGSGKSSLIQAGMLPELAAGVITGSDRWHPILVRPGQDLPTVLERELPGFAEVGIEGAGARFLAGQSEFDRILLVIDQFEELFSDPRIAAGGPEGPASAALGQLTQAMTGHGPVAVLLVLRDDFYPQLAAVAPSLLEVLPRLINVPATLSKAELRDIIVLPAQAAGGSFENGLPQQIISDVLAGTHQAPVTQLPMLQLALSRLWERCGGGHLTLAGYRGIGGVTGSLATWCNEVIEQLDGELKPTAQRILTALVRTVGDGDRTLAVRQPVPKDMLRELAIDLPGTTGFPSAGGAVDAVLAALRDNRIIIICADSRGGRDDSGGSQPVVELIHETLIRDWPELRTWVAQDRRFHDWLHRASEQHDRWVENHNPDDLLHGTDLAEGLDWRRQRGLPRRTSAFLAASKRRQLAGIRRIRRFAAALALALIAATVAGSFAYQQRDKALAQRNQTIYGQIITEADLLQNTDPSLAAQLDLLAYRTRPRQDVATRLINAADTPLSAVLNGPAGGNVSVVFSRDGRTLASAGGDGKIQLWNLSDPSRPAAIGPPLVGAPGFAVSVAFSPDGHTLAATDGEGGTVRLWNLSDLIHPKALPPLTAFSPGAVFSVAFSQDGHTLASAGDGPGETEIRLWNLADPAHPTALGEPLTGITGTVFSVAFSPDGRTLADTSVTGSNTIRLWNLSDPAHPVTLPPLTDTPNGYLSVVFSPDWRTLASVGDDSTTRLWNLTDPAHPTALGKLLTDTADGAAEAFSPDGHMLASASSDNTIRLLNLSDPARPTTLGSPLTGHASPVTSLAFSPDGGILASASSDGIVRLWSRPSGVLVGHAGTVFSVAFSPDGHTLASAGNDNTIRLWNLSDPAHPTALGQTLAIVPTESLAAPGVPIRGVEASLLFSPDGHVLAISDTVGYDQLWNISDPAHPLKWQLPEEGGVPGSVAFSPDGHILATADLDRVQLWDISDLAQPTKLGSSLSSPPTDSVSAVAFSPDGHTLAVAVDNGDSVQLWDVRSLAHRTAPDPPNGFFSGESGTSSLTFSPAGHIVASNSGDGTTRFWDVSNPAHLTELGPPMTGPTGGVAPLSFSPDGRTLARPGNGDSVQLWDVSDPARLKALGPPLTGHTAAVTSVAFSPNGQTLAAASEDGTIRLWDQNPSHAIDWICGATQNSLTKDIWHSYVPQLPYRPPCPQLIRSPPGS